jgi:hypothetical protein
MDELVDRSDVTGCLYRFFWVGLIVNVTCWQHEEALHDTHIRQGSTVITSPGMGGGEKYRPYDW